MIVALAPELLARLSRLDDSADAAVTRTLDADLAAAVRRTAVMRRVFYAAVLAVALYGTATGAVARFGLPWPVAIGGIFALELGGVVFLSNAETRRRLGEPAALSRLLGAVVAGAAAMFNLVTHASLLLGGFFALMSVLGFLAWWLDVENKRRDRLRARGQLAAATPSYGLWGHWLRHPLLTRRARWFARAYPQLGLYGSLEAAVVTAHREKRNAALAASLHARIRAAVSKDMADIAVLTYDMDDVAQRLRASADYDGLTALLGSELTAERMLHGRDDQAAVAARVWLADHRDSQPQAITGSHNDGHTPRQVPVAAPPNEHHDGGDEGVDLAAHLINAIPAAGSPQAQANGNTPNGHSIIPVTIASLHPGASNGESPKHADRPGSTPARLRPPGGPMAGHEHTTQPGSGQLSPSEESGSDHAVNVRVLGTPAILGADGSPVRGLRTKSLELLVYLALHRDGAAQSDIVAAIWPDVTAERAVQRLSTCLANLRSVIRQVRDRTDREPSGTDCDTRVEPVANIGGTYRLDPAIVAVDWWQAVDTYIASHRTASEANDQAKRWCELGDVLDSLAEDSDYPWIKAGRDRVGQDLTRRFGVYP